MFKHDVLSQDEGQELLVSDVLDDGRHDVSGLLEDHLVVPVVVDAPQFRSNPVVFPHHEQVHDGQDCLLVDPRVSGQETVNILRFNERRQE